MLKKEIELKQHLQIEQTFLYEDGDVYHHDLIQKITNIQVKGSLTYQQTLKCVVVDAQITADLEAIDARDGQIITKTGEKFAWNDEYYFADVNDDQHNLVLGGEFDIKAYAIEQIVLNIPLNFTNNCGKISFVGKDFKLMSEEEYQQDQEERLDPRWDVLKNFKIDK